MGDSVNAEANILITLVTFNAKPTQIALAHCHCIPESRNIKLLLQR